MQVVIYFRIAHILEYRRKGYGQNFEEILRILGKNIRRIITNADIDITKLSEIRLRSFMPLIIRYDGRDLFITPEGKLDMHEKYAYRVSSEDIKETFVFLSDYSVYASRKK